MSINTTTSYRFTIRARCISMSTIEVEPLSRKTISCVRKTGPRSNKIKQMQKQKHRRHTIQERHRFTWFTQCGLRPPEKLPGPSFIIIQQMKGYNLQQKPAVTSSSFSHSLLSQNTIFTLVHSRNTFPS
jgi:hypothetical protein